MSEVERCLAFLAWVDERCAQRTEPFAFGTAYFDDTLPLIRSLNLLVVDRGLEPPFDELCAEAERLHSAAGHSFRRISIRDDDVGARLAPRFADAGWKPDPLLVMPFEAPLRDVDASEVVEVARADLEPAWDVGVREAPWANDEVARQIVGQRRVIGEATSARYFAVREDGEVASYCELYTDGETGQIEGVLTLERFRGRGYASAVVMRAVRESLDAGHTLTFLLAEEEDWPKELYAKLGFERAGRFWDFATPPLPG